MANVKENRKKIGQGGKKQGIDPTMEFFNLGATFKPQVIKTSRIPVDHSKKPTAPPIISQDDDDDEFFDCVETSTGLQKTRNEFKYAKEIKATEMRMYNLLRENSEQKKKIHNDTLLSNIEENTMPIPEESFSNRIHNDPLFEKYFDFTKKRCVNLAISKDEDAIIELIQNERVSIISGHTGCGKTTQVPQFILEDHARRGKSVNIIVTQPRKIAAKSISKRICQERNWEMGRIVGYKVGLDKENASLDTRLLFCTTGIFKKMIIAKKNLNDWTHIILDEVHEREMDMDFVLLLCKRLINTNSNNVKLVLMSATIDTARFKEYFSWSIPGAEKRFQYTAGVYSMKDIKSYSVKEFYLNDLEKDKIIRNNIPAWPYHFEVESPYVVEECIQIASQIILKLNYLEQRNNIQDLGAVLVFLPGEAEISRVKKYLEEICKSNQVPWWILPLHSRIPFEEMQRIFDNKKGYRKIILSTNVAESSLTIPDVCYVIDFCLQKLIMADQYTNYVSLRLQWADKNSCTQRKGRAGRVRSGFVFRLVPKEFYDILDECVTAEMIRAPLEKVILDTKLLDFGPPKELLALAMEAPKLKNIHKTTMRLKEIGALMTTKDGVVTLDDGDLTVLGEIIASLPVDISLGKLIVLGHILNILEECIIIAAGMSNNSLFAMPFGRKLKAFADKLCWSNKSFSDCLAILVAYQTWHRKLRTGEFNRIPEGKWCKERHLQVKVLHEMREAIEDIKQALQRHHIDTIELPNRYDRRHLHADHIMSSEKDILKLKIAIFGAFYPNYFVRTGLGLDEKEVYKELYNNSTSSYHEPSSCIYFSNFDPQQVPFSSLYIDQIKNMFDGIDNRNIDVEFDGQRIIVQFANDTGRRNLIFSDQNTQSHCNSIMNESFIKNCDILQEVYIAMKLRQEPSEMLRVRLFPPEIARQKMLLIDQQIREMSLFSNKILVYQDIGIRDPPTLAQNILHLEINHVNNPNSFWINYLSANDQDVNDNQLAKLDIELENVMSDAKHLKSIEINKVEINQLFLAPYEGTYYRARVDSLILSDKKVKAFFVDYGNTEIINISKMFVIDTELVKRHPFLIKTPALAHECSLSFVKPNLRRKYDGSWDEYSVAKFKDTVEPNNQYEPVTFVGKVLSVVPNVSSLSGHLIYLTLFKKVNDVPTNDLDYFNYKHSINHRFQCLKDNDGHHLALYTAENYMSQLNRQLRESHNSFNAIEKAERENCQLNFIGANRKTELQDSNMSSSIFKEGTRDDQKTLSVQLKGPYHPLKFSVTATHRIGSCKKANVEPDSVNSVLLNKSPNDKHDAWLVAGHVGTNPSGDALVLRSTTLMPNIKGLGVLLAMTFSPEVEMRYDSKLQRYTGCLLGLGYRRRVNLHSESNQTSRSSTQLEDWNYYSNYSSEYIPYQPEHDMELQFDVNVDNDDINLINQLRYRISLSLTRINQKREDGSLLPLEQRMREIPARLTIPNYLTEDQDKIDLLFDQLLSRKRKVISKQHFKNEHHWCQLPPAHMLYHPQIHNEHELLLKMITQISFSHRKK